MSKARKRRDRKKAREVNRTGRVKPTPETIDKLRPHPMELLLQRGREHGGIDADQWQCAEEIIEARDTLAAGLGYSSNDLQSLATLGFAAHAVSYGEMPISRRAEFLTAVWQLWAVELERRWKIRRPFAVVERIESALPFPPALAVALGAALDLWGKVRHDLAPRTREVSTIRGNAG